MYLNYINYFRGFAILMIVLGHTAYFGRDTFINKILLSILISGTGLFVFISGFLFYHIFYLRGFIYKKFMINKVKNVLLPYTVVSLPILIWGSIKYQITPDIFKYGKIPYICISYIFGTILFSTWYIPFAMLLFLISPIFIKFIKMKDKYQRIVIIIGVLVSMIVYRPTFGLIINEIQNLIYFFPFYCLGIYIAINQKKIAVRLEKNILILGIIWIIYIFFQIKLNNYFPNHKNLFEIKSLDMMIVQKILMSLFFMGVFIKLEKSNLNSVKKIFDLLGDYSFGIFFIHNYILAVLGKILSVLNIKISSVLESISYGVSVVVCSMIIVWIVKKIFKKKSRYIIGS